MADMNNVCVTGRLTRDVEVKNSMQGTKYGRFTVACNGFKEGDTVFLSCTLFGKILESRFIDLLKKGVHVAVSGRLSQKNDGEKTHTSCIVGDVYLIGEKRETTSESEKPFEDDIPF